MKNTDQTVDQRKFALGHILAFGPKPEWGENFDYDSHRYRGKILTGKYAHYCMSWDELPTDETCIEFASCHCYEETDEIKHIRNKLLDAYHAANDGVSYEE
jgi:hypothetical protein